ncbi:MAG: stage II sporulation protein D [Firmicutes bacterium]|nr:stage II sporulation protein D [Bacillota bacterium]
MQNRILLIIAVVLSLILFILNSSSQNTTFFNSEPNITIKNNETNDIHSIDLEEYIIGVVAAEMPASFNEEALKAQAVASRTYATYKMQTSNKDYDVVTDVSDQSYITIDEMKDKWNSDFNKYYTKISDAVRKTKGQIMYYGDEVIEAYYFSMSNGYTEQASLVFSEDKEYLQSVESSYDNEDIKNFEVITTFTQAELCEKLSLRCDNISFTNIKRSKTNRVNSITVNDIEFKGTVFRSKLGLRSTDFTIEEINNQILITTRGYGHGVGMSQYGANGMANAGYTYEEILKYYYKNIKISSI